MLFSIPSHADRIYRLVDYPANQNGHFLTGTITTTNDAPNDSLLDVAEILSWQWSISGANTNAASSQDFLDDLSSAVGVRMTPSAISLPADSSATTDQKLTLSRHSDLGPRNVQAHALYWQMQDGNPAGAIFSASRTTGDVVQGFWFGPATFASSSGWVIAVAVPEPATALLAIASAIACVLRRRLTFSRGGHRCAAVVVDRLSDRFPPGFRTISAGRWWRVIPRWL